ncbi:MAG: hypothetical protein SFZ23_13250 [Planctomycetota bacterium]|nr:hypothetical protein [Planctomycetota bacterium]
MAFIADRDLLALEPNLFRDVGWLAQTLVSGVGDVVGAALTLGTFDVSFAAAGVGAGHVAQVDGVAYEVIARTATTVVELSRLRGSTSDAAIPPTPTTGKPVVVTTFMPQIVQAHGQILRMLGIDSEAGTGQASEANIMNPGALARAEGLLTLFAVASAAAALGPAYAAIAQRASFFRREFEKERQRAAAILDVDGDGAPDATRRLNVVLLTRN